MMLYMLDTNICIYLIKKKSNLLLNRMLAFRTGEIGVSVITVAELQYGVIKSQYKERNLAALEGFLLPLEIADFTNEMTVTYGHIRADLERYGQPIGPLDTMIASHALALDVTLVTNNSREFARVKGLHIEDWTK